jgi:lipoprotein-releasing system ATP-binding protein
MSNQINNQVVLHCQQVIKSYDVGSESLEVLKQLDLEVKQGEMLAIVGSSGSGKTTLLHILAGLDVADAGSVTIAGQNIANISEKKRALLRNKELGFVFQFHHLLPEFTALENLLIPIRLTGKVSKEQKEYALYLLEAVGLKDRINHRPSELSGGERQRVAIARALVNKPSLVLLDEPTGNLDQDTAEHIQNLLVDLKQKFNASFIVVTHSKELAASLDRCLTLDHGQLIES